MYQYVLISIYVSVFYNMYPVKTNKTSSNIKKTIKQHGFLTHPPVKQPLLNSNQASISQFIDHLDVTRLS